MVFVDGTNVLAELPKRLDCKKAKKRDELELLKIGLEVVNAWRIASNLISLARINWFGSCVGNDEQRAKHRQAIRSAGFEPFIFPRKPSGKEKGVDIALTRLMLVHAFQRNMGQAVLASGDEDYVELVDEVKRYGCQVTGAFYLDHGFSRELRMRVDVERELVPNHVLTDHPNWKTRVDATVLRDDPSTPCPTCGAPMPAAGAAGELS